MKVLPRFPASPLAIFIAVLASAAITSRAANLQFDGSADANWSTHANWAGDVAPSNGDNLTFSVHPDTGNRFSANNDLLTSAGLLTFGGETFTLTGNALSLSGGVTVSAGDQILSLASLTLEADQTWSVNASSLTVTSNLDLNGHYLKAAGTGTFSFTTLTGAGTNSNLEIAADVSITGTASHEGYTIVDGGELTLTGSITATTNTYVGNEGASNQLTIQDGGMLTNGSGTIGLHEISDSNSVTVTGETSSWTSTGDLNVGYEGSTNTLDVEDGGSVSASSIKIGGFVGSDQNSITVNDAGVTATASVIVGYSGTQNVFTAELAADVSSVDTIIGLNATASDNAINVRDANTTWTNTGTVYVGDAGDSNTLSVTAGGTFTVNGTNKDLVIGHLSGSNGNSVTVSGTDSLIENASTLYVGDNGDSNMLTIDTGGTVSGKNARIGGNGETSHGNSATVDGDGSTWTNTGTLRVGSFGYGNSLTVTDGGTVDFTGNAFVGYASTADSNSISISGTGSSLTVGTLTIGRDGSDNEVIVSSGGSLISNGDITIGANSGSSGTLTIGDNAGSGAVSASQITGGAGTASVVFSHTDVDKYIFTAVLSGSLSVTHSSTGTTSLTGNNTYTGDTLVEAGTLLADALVGSSTGSGDVIVDSGATIGGAGSIGGDLFVSGSLAPGDSIGTLTVDGSVTWNASIGNEWSFELAEGDMSDLLSIGGDFIKGTGSDFVFDFEGTGALGTFTLVDWDMASGFAFDDFSYTGLAGGYAGYFQIDGSQLLFTTSVPEPSTYAILLGVAAMGAAVWRRRMIRQA